MILQNFLKKYVDRVLKIWYSKPTFPRSGEQKFNINQIKIVVRTLLFRLVGYFKNNGRK